jgi:DNA modification methylase
VTGRVEKIGSSELYLGNCLEILPLLGEVDVIITDPPYGATDHAWDIVVDPRLWMICGTVSFAIEPFATELINQAPMPFKYDLVWRKNTATNLRNCAIRPARTHERILVFGNLDYIPQKRRRTALEMIRLNRTQRQTMEFAHPGSVLEFDAVNNRSGERNGHPSQKPVKLLSWLIRSYSIGARTILDPFMGSGTTGVACAKLGRRFIGIEIEPKYFDIACQRIEEAHKRADLFIEQPKSTPPKQMAL